MDIFLSNFCFAIIHSGLFYLHFVSIFKCLNIYQSRSETLCFPPTMSDPADTYLFPKVTLMGEVGYSAASFGEFGQSQARYFQAGPSISWAAFDMGRVLARIGESRAQTDAAVASYQSAVLNALSDS